MGLLPPPQASMRARSEDRCDARQEGDLHRKQVTRRSTNIVRSMQLDWNEEIVSFRKRPVVGVWWPGVANRECD